MHKERRSFTQEEYTLLEGYSAIRLPLHDIAALFNLSYEHFNQLLKKDAEARRRIEFGKAKASAAFRKFFFKLVMNEANPEPRLIEFWAKSQEGFRIQENINITGSIDLIPKEHLNVLSNDPEAMQHARFLAAKLVEKIDEEAE